MASFYEQRMLRLFERYELSDNTRAMFKALDEFKTSRIDEAALGRLIRLSPSNRAALVNTIVKCASIMKDSPKEAKYCMTIITGCGDMLEIADKPTKGVGFPGFLKLPPEIRDRIYNIYLRNYKGAPNIIPVPKKGSCSCAPHEPPQYERFPVVDMSLGFTSKRISDEFLPCFYRKRNFHFPCACEMGHHLMNNTLLKSTMNRVMFHWCGPHADSSISQLHGMGQLEVLTVVVSKATSKLLTAREQEIREFFGAKRSTYNSLPESRGWDELISIRGLKGVSVEHVNKRKADRRTDEERRCLENILKFYVLRPADNHQ
ncbi:hypothetical protein NUW58_g3971 [Xylaria curta]|uniref:Uncharacterized protein n=1 Tax=Xylaria curta TaxID=42375 RepID=A0ACC1PA55_9PEZI|nr:hypothetical protein NUW58_g3971 [Xylaria curta]